MIGTTARCVVGFRLDLIKAMIAEGHEVFALAIDYDEELKKRVEASGAIPVDYSLSRSGLNPFVEMFNTFRLYGLLRELRPDMVFSYFPKPVIFGTMAAALAGVQTIIGMLEGLGYAFTVPPGGVPLKTKIVKFFQILLYRISFMFLDRIIFLNSDDPEDLVSHYNIKVKKIDILGGIGLNLQQFPYSKPDLAEVSFIFVGRLLAEKGINEYIAAAKIVKKNYPEAKFMIIGEVDENNPGSLKSLDIGALVDQGLVIYPGHVDNVQEWLGKASVLVLPTYYREGLPRSIQEAMAVGRPVITTDVPGCRESVINGENGFLVPPWAPERLAEQMIYFIENPQRIETMGLESRKIAIDKFDAQKVNRRLMTILGL